ncbi:SDR family NAD(P)-dependent oxidoreductase [Alsobacter sp. KACC 23698]|uniref:SDR family NAD(P)-dependent oxidoreductase n=1 Tax=Alsobacter sp. KACC 23698 TaxID=3149229 RepID=A0AAU7JF40_9HYPH
MSIWFITGASRGFGALVAQHALERGDAVVATARDPKAIVDRIGSHPDLLTLALDVTRRDQAIAAAQAAVDRFGAIDILLNNAGFGLLGAVEEASDDEIEAVFRTNVFGLLAVTQAVLPHMRMAGFGRILNISSIGGYRGSAGFGVYGATKFAVEALTESLRAELAPLGIHVTAIEPGYFRTDFMDASSLKVSRTVIPDYSETVGKVRANAGQVNGAQPGNPARLAEILVDLAHHPDPPVRLPLGADTVAAIEAKHASDTAILDKWRAVALSTGFDR